MSDVDYREEEEVDMGLLKRIGMYISKGTGNYEIRTRDFLPGEDRTLESVPTKWVVTGARAFAMEVCRDIEGRIVVDVAILCNISEEIWMALRSFYKEELKKVKDEEKSELIKKMVEEKFRIQNELRDRNNWSRYFSQKSFEKLMQRIMWGDVAATMASREFGVKVVYWIPPTPDEYVYFYSVFDTKDMSNDQVFDEVRKRIDAVRKAERIYYFGEALILRKQRAKKEHTYEEDSEYV